MNGTIFDYKQFLKDNQDKIREKAIPIEELPEDDEWINDSEWDDIYTQEVKHE